MISELEQQTLDVDWFFIINENIAFVASGGGKLPNSVAISLEKTLGLASYFRSLPEKSEVIINPDLNKIVVTSINEEYLNDFIQMAQKGFFCYDKTILNNFSDYSYHLVAIPIDPLETNSLPFEIREILSKTQKSGGIQNVIDIKSIE